MADSNLESKTGEKKLISTCPNCGTEVVGNFCHECGQNQSENILPLNTVFKEILWETINLDHRFFQSLKYLLFRPGYLTHEYIAGKRVVFSSPLRMFLLISAIYFAVLVITDTNILFGGLTVNPVATEGLKVWLPRIMFLLMPVFAVLLKVLYFRTGKLYIEHLIFALHYYSFYFLSLIALAFLRSPLDVAVPDIRTAPVWLVIVDGTIQTLPLIYLYISLKVAYKQKTGITILKIILILAAQIIFLMVCGDIAEMIWH